MKLTKLLYSIIFYFAIKDGIYYTVAGDDDTEPDAAGAGGADPETGGGDGGADPETGGGDGGADPETPPNESSGGNGNGNTPPNGNGNVPPERAAGPNRRTNNRLKGEGDKKIIKEGCNFYEREDLGIKPYSQLKKDGSMCRINLNEEADAFMYACDGTSDPPNCPSEVTTDEGIKKLEGFFTQATVTDESRNYPETPKVYHVITGKANKTFSASCVCTRQNGDKETMELTSSFKPAGIIGILGFIILYLIK